MVAEADYIVVGGGSAGAALAARLSERSDVQVLLLEAGPERNDIRLQVPAGVFGVIANPDFDWVRMGEPDPTIGGRQMLYPAGKLLGGSSAINGLVYNRGARADYDDWEALGATGWNYGELLPYFLRSEGFRGPPRQHHGSDGPFGVSPIELHPLSQRFIDSCGKIGLPSREDGCDGEVLGAYPTVASIDGGLRSSTYRDYLKPARNRPNLHIVTEALADRILLEGKKAVGVRYLVGSETREAKARREIILSAGAFGSPTILQRSGIGAAEKLRALGIAPLLDAPGIGANMQDHLANTIVRFVDAPTLNEMSNPLKAALAGLQFIFTRKGPLASPSVQAMAYGKSRPELANPDFMLSFLPLCIDFATGKPQLHKRQGVFIAVNVCRPAMRGEVFIRSADPHEALKIEMPILAEQEDVEVLRAGLATIMRIFHEGFGEILSRDQSEALPNTDEGWLTWIKERTALGYHTVGTCRMGGVDAPLDPQLRVRGIDGLRVADASVIPRIPSGNTNAAAIMIGEKAADILRS